MLQSVHPFVHMALHLSNRISHYPLPSCQMVDTQMDKALVFEDDVRFQANFKRRALRLMEEVEQAELDWDIM